MQLSYYLTRSKAVKNISQTIDIFDKIVYNKQNIIFTYTNKMSDNVYCAI